MKTYSAKEKELNKKWYLIDAKDQVLGRLATKVADLLRGKRKEIFTPHVDCGDFVIVINAEKVRLTGKKEVQKEYKTFSGFPGGQKIISFERMKATHPEQIITHAVKGMLPSTRLGRAVFKKLKVYAGSEYPHSAQKAEKIEI